MMKRFPLLVVILLASAVPAAAQDDISCTRTWGSIDYLLFWIKDGPNPNPLVTTGPPGSAGILDLTGTRTLFGGERLDFGTHSGLRTTLGTWLDDGGTFGVEGSGFLLERRSEGFSVRSDATGNPTLAFPIRDVSNGLENAFVVASPGLVAGGATVDAQTRLWGAELNGVVNLARTSTVSFDGLAGFRYLHLDENLEIGGAFATLPSPLGGFAVTTADRFATRNQFYGGQLGGRLSLRGLGPLDLGLVGKIALGSTHQVISTTGATNIQSTGLFAGTTPSAPGGVFTQRSNLGTRSDNDFTVIPEAQIEVGYNVSDRVRLAVGYNFLYDSSVVRPGAQVDRNINPTTSSLPPGVVAGPAGPLPRFDRDDFFAHGVHLSLGFKF